MIKKFLLLLLLATTFVNAQHTITGKMQPKGDYEWMILYHMQGAKQNYIANADIIDGAFSFSLADSLDIGIYRLVYDLQNQLFVDVIYNNEDISLSFNPENPNQKIQFKASEENKQYYNYLKKNTPLQYKMDSLQVAYFNTTSSIDKNAISSLYEKGYTALKKLQQQSEKESTGKLAHQFIKASARFNTDKPLNQPSDYLKSVKTHFFDYVDFNDKTLLNSTFITDKINDYIFYLNASEDTDVDVRLKKDAIATVITKIGANYGLAKNIEEVLLYNFTQQQNIPVVRFILDTYYSKLPVAYQDMNFVKDVESKIKTAIGSKAPNINWTTNTATNDLYSLSGFETYLVVFWSSQCGHCLKEIPKLNDYLKGNTKIKVIAVGMEEETSKPVWEKLIVSYPTFINVYGVNKWKNEFSQAYGVTSTPSYFVLDANKNIIAKPDNIEDVEAYFNGNK